MGSHTSLGMVVVGESLAGHFAARHVPDVGRVGLRAGVVGYLGGTVGGWLAVETRKRGRMIVDGSRAA